MQTLSTSSQSATKSPMCWDISLCISVRLCLLLLFVVLWQNGIASSDDSFCCAFGNDSDSACSVLAWHLQNVRHVHHRNVRYGCLYIVRRSLLDHRCVEAEVNRDMVDCNIVCAQCSYQHHVRCDVLLPGGFCEV